MNRYDLNGKTSFVTGARRGIGRAIALRLAESGAKVAVADLDAADCEKVASEIRAKGGEAIALALDVTREDSIVAALARTVEQFGRLDILINNAGIYIQRELTEMDTAQIDAVLNVNLRGMILCVKHALPGMKQRKYGKIVNIASIAGFVGFELSAVYCATKGAVVNLTRELALDLARYRINVNGVAPGSVETPMTADLLKDAPVREAILAKIPCGRIGTPGDIANAACFLVTDDSEYITGDILVVDGGWLTS